MVNAYQKVIANIDLAHKMVEIEANNQEELNAGEET